LWTKLHVYKMGIVFAYSSSAPFFNSQNKNYVGRIYRRVVNIAKIITLAPYLFLLLNKG